MTVYEAVLLNGDLLRRLSQLGVRTGDWKLLPVYEGYLRLRGKAKTTYVVAKLAEVHGVSERTVYRTIRRFERQCHLPSASS